VAPFVNQDHFTIALNNPPDGETGPEFIARLGIDSGIADGHKPLIPFVTLIQPRPATILR